MKRSYRAAHRMDTDWFAVDANGHIAVFHSGEAGAVPVAYVDVRGHHIDIDELLELFPQNEAGHIEMEFDPRHFFVGPPRLLEAYDWAGQLLEIVPGYDDEVSGIIDWNNVIIAFPRCRNVFYVDECQDEAIKALPWVLKNVAITIPELLGMYQYEAPSTDAAEPYERLAQPIQPLLFKDMPEDVQKYLSVIILDGLTFVETERFQPFEILPSTTWRDTWVGVDGVEHEVDD